MTNQINDNQHYTPKEFEGIIKAIDILARYGLKPYEVLGLYENRTIHPDLRQRRLLFDNPIGIVSLPDFVEGTESERETITNALQEFVDLDLSPAFIVMAYELEKACVRNKGSRDGK